MVVSVLTLIDSHEEALRASAESIILALSAVLPAPRTSLSSRSLANPSAKVTALVAEVNASRFLLLEMASIQVEVGAAAELQGCGTGTKSPVTSASNLLSVTGATVNTFDGDNTERLGASRAVDTTRCLAGVVGKSDVVVGRGNAGEGNRQ